ncbi:flagellin FliC [Cupriavidus taiwanensis]|uniref:Flagellin n=1 Tax=Cupriavidus taiwanensis TaxID=164546 RepID=A0A375F7Z9_9BURK|nr:flagellin FliC [Cupriavidus taiwanensis]SOZ08911.1 flagellar filament structural protein (flagellin) [Cupriavidus taiwanensis]SOZ11208.1 flagellar filament structural protein (flagellin) [Cupriavidus taiwanensis]SOZ42558.1 flagellar filament structural protein (flagellin) [Cupriavidus taiwanensis]SPA54946.1 flagellar filament structural protein (flagellin) [Cupriavidus taiwanensis]SPC21571.1 flagellar filament structural protein (flagellin) [Cupriavidus taiwanensis]
MAQVINTNSLSLMTQNNLNASQSSLNTAIQRLSSGLRINSAKDDAAGQAIANRFTANIRGLTQAQRNANDGISLAQTTEGALTEVNNNLQRIRELAVQASTGSNSSSDLKSIQDEINQRLAEIDRTSQQTDFNGVKVLAGSNKLSVQVGANDGETISIDLKQIDKTTLGLSGFSVAKNSLDVGPKITTIAAAAGTGSYNVSFAAGDITKINAATGKTFAAADLELHEVKTAAGANSGQFVVKAGDDYFAASVDRTTGAVKLNEADVAFDDTANGITGPVTLQDQVVRVANNAAGVATGYVTVQGKNYAAANTLTDGGAAGTLNVAVGTISLSGTPTAEFTGVPTGNALKKIDAALKQVDDLRSSLGAVQNRFDSVISNLGTTVTNLSSSRSRIQDADYATEVSNMTRANILQQAGTSVLAQANQTTQGVLSLLR